MERIRTSCRWGSVPNQGGEEEVCSVKKMLRTSICCKREALGLERIDLTQEENKITKPKYSYEDELQRKIRRERNKLSARRCRKRKKEERNRLKKEKDQLISESKDLMKAVMDLNEEKQRLESMLLNHNCQILKEQTFFSTTDTPKPSPTQCRYTDFADVMSTPLDQTYIDLSYFK